MGDIDKRIANLEQITADAIASLDGELQRLRQKSLPRAVDAANRRDNQYEKGD